MLIPNILTDKNNKLNMNLHTHTKKLNPGRELCFLISEVYHTHRSQTVNTHRLCHKRIKMMDDVLEQNLLFPPA